MRPVCRCHYQIATVITHSVCLQSNLDQRLNLNLMIFNCNSCWPALWSWLSSSKLSYWKYKLCFQLILELILGYVMLDRSSLALGCVWFCLVVFRWYLALLGCILLVFGADWLGDHQNGASAYVLHLSGSSSHLRVSSLIAVFLQIAPYVCSSPLCNNQISLHRTKQAGSLCDPRPWHHVCAHYSSPLCNNQTNTTQSTVCTTCVYSFISLLMISEERHVCL